MGSGCGTVGRAVASNIRGPRFESSHRQLLLNIDLLLTVCRKYKNKEKEAGNGPFLKNKKIFNCATNLEITEFLKWAIHGLFLFIFVFSLQLTVKKCSSYKSLPMTGFEPRTSGVGSDHLTNRTTTTGLLNHF